MSIATLICYYGVGIPLALFFGFELELGNNGFWYGYIIAMAIVDMVVIYLVVVASWEAKFKLEPKSASSREKRLKMMSPGGTSVLSSPGQKQQNDKGFEMQLLATNAEEHSIHHRKLESDDENQDFESFSSK